MGATPARPDPGEPAAPARRRRPRRRTTAATAATAALVVVVLAAVVGLRASAEEEPGSLPGWRLDFVDEFDAGLDERWNVVDDWGAENESSWIQADNVQVDDGVLRVRAAEESAGGRDYTSGRLDTNGTYALPDRFRAEVRARVPMQEGMWAAPLWLRPVDDGDGEIDLVETYGAERDDPLVHQTIHTAYGEDHDWVSTKTRFADLDRSSATDWHTYTVEKTPGRITMWVDGIRTARFDAGSADWFDRYYEAGTEWNLRLNLQVGGSFGLPDDTTDWSGDATTMQVDYVRTWVPEDT